MRAGFFVSLLTVVLLTGPAVHTQQMPPGQTTPSRSKHAGETLWQFGRREKICIEWTDGCRGCRRIDGNHFSCSNIGIACQPQEIRCTLRPGDIK
jgi:hypothetical protein